MNLYKIKKIQKRDGRIVDFDKEKIKNAIYKAECSIENDNRTLADGLANKVVTALEEKFGSRIIPNVETVQDFVEKVLMENGRTETARSYILYRQHRKEIREAKALLGVQDDIKLSINAIKVLERRYLKKDTEGKVIETPQGMFRRVAENIAQADKKYDKNADVKKVEEEFFEVMRNLEFIPNSPTLMNAGRELQQLSACFVLPVGDSMEEIFDAIKNAALIHKSGGGTGFSFSRLRPRGSMVLATRGVASGPLSFMKVFNTATETIKQGGTRRGANMGILRVDHPDILDFIIAKERDDALNNFNFSVGLTEEFMKAVVDDQEYGLYDPHLKEIVSKLNARKVFDLIVTMAWKNGEPGIIFLDRINRANPTPLLGEIESTNPCGEVPLLPYESCNLGSINLTKVVTEVEGRKVIDFDKLKKITRTAVHFLDNVIDMCLFPLKEIEQMVQGNRKIGLGVMGFSDMLIQLGIPYDSEEGITVAENVMEFINKESKLVSAELAKQRGIFPNFKGSIYDKPNGIKLRNATTTTIAPTGTISIIANCSSGIEPLFGISYIRNVMDNTELLEVNPHFEEVAHQRKFYSDTLMRLIAKKGTIQDIDEIPADVRRVFVTALDISPEYHIKMQAAFQKFTDNAVSKTVNFPNHATLEDIKKVFLLAYELGCKGVTVYRYGSRDQQVLYIDTLKKDEEAKEEVKDEQTEVKKVHSEYAGGCENCTV